MEAEEASLPCQADLTLGLSVCPSARPGISQSRISHWLLQQGSDLSEQKKRAFFRWYQLEKTNPGDSDRLPNTFMHTIKSLTISLLN